MKEIKNILIIYEDGSSKGYNKNAFIQVLKTVFDAWYNKHKEELKQKGENIEGTAREN